MYRIVTCLTTEHDYWIVLLAAIVCLATAFASFKLYSHVLESDGTKKWLWLLLTGLNTAAGIWATHFVAMIAYRPSIPTAYDPAWTIVSLLLAAVTTLVGFEISSGGHHWATVAQQLHIKLPRGLSGRFASWPRWSGSVRVSDSILRNIWTRMRAGAPSPQAGARLWNKELFELARAQFEKMAHIVSFRTGLFENIQVRARAVPVPAAIGGAIIGAGIGMMHFTGMLSLSVAGTIEWDWTLVLASLVVGITLASAAMVAFHQLDRSRRNWIAPALFVLAVCGLHFTAMGASIIIPDPTVVVPEAQFGRTIMAIFVASVTLLVIITCVLALVFEKLSSNIRARTEEVAAAKARFELALSQSDIAVFHHDMFHRCIWGHNCVLAPEAFLGKTDSQILPPAVADVLIGLKKKALMEPGLHEGEVCIDTGKGELWSLIRVVRRTDTHGQVIGTTSITLDISERKRWENHLFLLMREVNHRSRNLLAVLSSISHCTAARSPSIEDFSRVFSSRLQSLLRAHEVVAQDQWSASSMQKLIDVQLAAHMRDEGDHVRVHGPEILLRPRAMQNLGLALHELATNSAKYGALSAAGGNVELYWRLRDRDGEKILQVAWREVGGPEVRPPKSKGFGSMLLDRVVGAELNGKSRIKYRRSGLVWLAEIGATHFVIPGTAQSESLANPFSREANLREQYDHAFVGGRRMTA